MKKLVSVIAGAVVLSSGAIAAPTMVKSNANDGGYVVTYDYKDRPVSDWYMTLRAELSFLNWKNTQQLDGAPEDSDSYSFKPVFGGNLSVGKWFNSNWRGDVEAGYIGYFSNKRDGDDYALQIPYVTLNGYYNFINGLYLGVGAGLALPTTTVDNVFYDFEGTRTKVGIGFMGSAMVGYGVKVNDNFTVDIRYRFSGISGITHERTIEGLKYTNKVGFILDNSISLGLRYNF